MHPQNAMEIGFQQTKKPKTVNGHETAICGQKPNQKFQVSFFLTLFFETPFL